MQFKRFRISGFKSFAEPVALDILPGLTGIVGPNGCGKSNLVESLKWVMGEASFKSMRGGSMEDVIFAGSALRPSREIAEVSLVLDNSSHDAPQLYNDKDEIEISRHIQREAGSHYQINGQESRARDVNLFFADLIGGAHSSALVSQGHVDQIILAKPKERRRILEEAAGITGLHARRHEAELKLNRAQENLRKLADTLKQTEQRLRHLKKQATQAERYRKISAEISKMEAARLYLRWQEAQLDLDAHQKKLHNEHHNVDLYVEATEQARNLEQTSETTLGQMRLEASQSASACERLEGERALLTKEAQQVEEKISTLQSAQRELADDKNRAEKMHLDSQNQINQLNKEEKTISSETLNEDARASAKQKIEIDQRALDQAEKKAETASQKNAEWNAYQLSLQRKLEDTQTKRKLNLAEQEKIQAQLQKFSAFEKENQESAQLKQRADEAYQTARTAEKNIRKAEQIRQNAELDERQKLHQLSEARDLTSKYEAEVQAMGKLFADVGAHAGKAVIDLIKGPWFSTRNLNMAMAAALGDDLMASLEEGSASLWKKIGASEKTSFFSRLQPDTDSPVLPAHAVALSKFIRKPDVLHKRLAQIGLIDADKGDEAQKELKPGQRLVSQEGHLWRWDGYCADPRIALATRNRLKEWRTFSALEAKAQKARELQSQAQHVLDLARDRLAETSKVLDLAKHQKIKLDEQAETQRDLWQQAAAKISSDQARKATLDEAARRLADNHSDAERLITETQSLLEKAQKNNRPAIEEQAARAAALEARDQLSAAKETHALIAQDIAKKQQRQKQIAESRLAAEKNLSQLVEQISVLAQRQDNSQAELLALKPKPQALVDKIQQTDRLLQQESQLREQAQEQYLESETQYQHTRTQTREAETKLSSTRESLARQTAICENSVKMLAERESEIISKYHREPNSIPGWVGLEPDSPEPQISEIEQKLERLGRELQRIGAPNLQAEGERQDLIEEYQLAKDEGDDLEKAIARLRRAISVLNREGRQRLLDAFDLVNKHFKEIFTRLFGGGRARLTLIDDEDVLEAGLDIIARPPGKAVQNMSLLSGGEKALTAIALLFAAFKTRPAPICVLDEVDAPLDDRNVERFCDLLDDIARDQSQGEIRFLVVTHHSLTLSRMDRLYGVTMEEKGVSRIVSVELEQAEKLREPMQAAE